MKWFVIVSLVAILGIAHVYADTDGGDIAYPVKNVGNVTFSHESHVKGEGVKCETCHPKIFPMSKEEGKRFSMEQMKKKQACGACHDGKKAFDVRQNCVVCHKK